jgi:IS605 OrfB family transposase
MIRTVKFSTKLLTATKQRRLDALRRELYSTTNKFIATLWAVKGKLDKATMDRVSGGTLSYRHKSNCLKQALETVVFTRKASKTTGRKATCPALHGALDLSSLVCTVERFSGSFDFAVKVSGLVKGKRIVIPVKSHKRVNYWLNMPGATIKQGCILGNGWAAIAIEIPDAPPRTTGVELGVDVGVNKLLACSNGQMLGLDIKRICQKVRRKKPGSKAKQRACAERKDYINRTVKQLPWNQIKTIAIEDLKGIKTGKQKNRGKTFRKAMSSWTARQVEARVVQLAQQSSACVVSVDPRNTSRRCPMCGSIDKANRVAEKFQCRQCNHQADADYIGSLNILARATGNWREPMVPVSQRS